MVAGRARGRQGELARVRLGWALGGEPMSAQPAQQLPVQDRLGIIAIEALLLRREFGRICTSLLP